MTGVPNSVSPLDTMAAHFRKINTRLSALERASSGGGGGGTVDWTQGYPTYDPRYVNESDFNTLGDARYVNIDGDTMTGRLKAVGDIPIELVAPTGTTQTYMRGLAPDGTTRWGYLNFLSDRVRLNSDMGPVAFRAGPGATADQLVVLVDRVNIVSAASPEPAVGLYFTGSRTQQMLNLYGTSYGIGVQSSTLYFRTSQSTSTFRWYAAGVHSDAAGDPGAGGVEWFRVQADGSYTAVSSTAAANVVAGNNASSGPRIRLHVPTSGNICYIDYAGWGAAGTEQLNFRAGTVTTLSLEDTVVRSMKNTYITGQTRVFHTAGNPALLLASGTDNQCYIALYANGATSVDAIGTRSGYIGYPNNAHLYVKNETAGGYVLLSSATNIDFYAGNVYQARFDSAGNLNVAKGAVDNTTVGVNLLQSGRIYSTADTATAYCFIANIIAAVDNNVFCSWRRSNTIIGSITANGTTAVQYLTTSDGRLKEIVGVITDDEAMERLRAYRPVKYQWKLDASLTAKPWGKPTGRVEWGMIAQEMNEVNEVAVSKGEREPHQYDFTPWSTDYGRITPDLVAAMQALDRRLSALEAA